MERYFLATLMFHLSLLLIRIVYVLFRDIDLSPEEAQYWLWSKFLDWSYYSKPPLIAYMNFLSTSILGDTELGVRINAIVVGFLIGILSYLFMKHLFKSPKLAFVSSVFISIFLPYDLASILFLTDTPLALFWVLTLYLFYKAINGTDKKYWILTGISAGLGFLSKYIMVIFLPIAVIYLWFFKKDVLFNRWFYISLGIAALFTLPVIIWNINHQFVSFKHVGTLAGVNQTSLEESISRALKHVGDYILSQLGFGFGFLFPIAIWTAYKSLFSKDRKLFYLAFPAAFVFFFFLFIALKRQVYANWPAFGYFSLYLLMAYFIWKKNLWRFITPLVLFNVLAVVVVFYTPILDMVGLGNLLPPKKDPTKRLVGWSQLANEVQKVRNRYPNHFLFSDDYFVSSELTFYLPDHRFVYCINLGRRMNQFDFWEKINSQKNYGKTGIYITKAGLHHNVKKAFDRLVFHEKFHVKYRGQVVKTFNIYVLEDFKGLKEIRTNRY